MASPQNLILYGIYDHMWKPSILNLNDYCLLNICQYLDVAAVIYLAKTCQRLQDIAEIFCYKKFKNLDSAQLRWKNDDPIKPIKLKIMLVKIGQYVTSFKLSAKDLSESIAHKTYLTIIHENCANLKHLVLEEVKNIGITERGGLAAILSANRKAIDFLKQLTTLELDRCTGSINTFVEQKNQLEHLAIRNDITVGFNGITLKWLKNLKIVEFVACPSLYPPYVAELFANCRIQAFTLLNCLKFKQTSGWFYDASENLTSLEYLHTDHELFKWNGPAEQKKPFPIERTQLKRLKIPRVQEDIENVLLKLSENDQLEELELSHCAIKEKKIRTALQYLTKFKCLNLNWNVNVDNELLISVAKNCTNLRELHCKGVDKLTCVYRVVELCRKLELFDVDIANVDFLVVTEILNLLLTEKSRPKLEIVIDSVMELALCDTVSIVYLYRYV